MRIHALQNAPAGAYDSSVVVLDPLAREARECLREQASAVAALAARIDRSFAAAVRLLGEVDGHVVVTGIGKSGLIGKKIAATLASTGTPSFFLHSAEAFHGDLGMVTEHDAVLLISYSGETDEVIRLLPHLEDRGIPMVGLVGNMDSTLARGVHVPLDVSVDREVCPNNLAPTSSTLAALAMGDALAVSLTRLRGFLAEDFARLHPGGRLGRRLHARVSDAMARKPVPTVSPDAAARDCVLALARSRLPVVLVMEGDRLVGMVSEAELRAALDAVDTLDVPVSSIMTTTVPTVNADSKVVDAELLMRRRGLEVLVAVDRCGKVCGVLTPPEDG